MHLVRAPKQQAGIALLVLGLVLAAVVITVPGVQAQSVGQQYSEFEFTFVNGTTFSGDTIGMDSFDVPFTPVPGEVLHVSCSDTYNDGWNSDGGFPNAVGNPDWEIASYFITRYRPTGEVHFTCGQTFTPDPDPVAVNVTVGYCVWDGQTAITPINVSIDPAAGATVVIAGEEFTSNGSIDLEPGTYMWSASPSPGYELVGPSSGEVVAPDCSPGAEPVQVAVTLGTCIWDGQQSVTTIEVSIDPAQGARVNIAGQNFFESGSIDIGPGAYDWSAVPNTGFVIDGPSSGTVTAVECSPQTDDVSVVVVAGDCQWDGQTSVTTVEITIDPAGGASVSLAGQTLSGAGGTVDLGPGTYDWTATASAGYELSGPSYGTVVAVDCEPEPEPVAVAVVAGDCQWDGTQSITEVSISIDPANGATVSIDGQTVGGSGGIVELTPGTYDWEATAEPGFEMTGTSAGTIEAIDCEVQPETVSVTVTPGECVWDGVSALADVTFVIDPAGGATVLLTGDGTNVVVDVDTTLAVGPGDYAWEATATDPYVLTGDSMGAFTIEDCEPLRGAIGDYVWEDLNGDGIQDSGEPGVEGVTVNLIVDGVVVETTTTDADGGYLFDELLPGNYSIEFVVPDGYDLTLPNQGGDDALDSDTSGGLVTVDLAEGEINLTIDAGLVQPAVIVVEKVTEPAADGVFSFTGDITADLANGESASETVSPGTYTVAETVPSGWALTDVTCSAGGVGNVDSAVAEYTVLSGDTVTCTFTNTNRGDLLIEKATDVDTDDIFSISVDGVAYELASGESVTIELESGEYTITEDLAVVDGWDLAAIVCSGEADPDPSSLSTTLVVEPGTTVGCTFLNTEAGATLGALGDYTWIDQNVDGIQDTGELAVGGVDVELLVGGSVIASTVTNEAGLYLFPNLDAGDYEVRFTAPEDYLFTDGLMGADRAKDSDVTESSSDAGDRAVGTTDTVSLAQGDINLTVDAGLFFIDVQSQNPPPEPKTPDDGSTSNETPEPTGPTASANPEPETQVLGIQVLPDTGIAQEGWALMALAMMLMGFGAVLIGSPTVAREEEVGGIA